MKRFLSFLFISILFFSCEGQDKSFEGDGKVDFVASTKVPIVSGTLNGKKTYFILDSGASLSVLDDTQSESFGFETSNSDKEAFGYGGVAKFKEASNVEITIGGLIFETDFKSQDLTGLKNLILEVDGYVISGIIGSDIMKKNNFILDYSTSTITIGR